MDLCYFLDLLQVDLTSLASGASFLSRHINWTKDFFESLVVFLSVSFPVFEHSLCKRIGIIVLSFHSAYISV